MHTSTVTVAVMDPDARDAFGLDARELEIRTARGSGPGGQHRNKKDTCVTVTHVPTGESVRVDMRSQHQSRAKALALLRDRLAARERARTRELRAERRRAQVGSGMRGDKIRTYRQQDDLVTDHKSGRSWSLKVWLRGRWD